MSPAKSKLARVFSAHTLRLLLLLLLLKSPACLSACLQAAPARHIMSWGAGRLEIGSA